MATNNILLRRPAATYNLLFILYNHLLELVLEVGPKQMKHKSSAVIMHVSNTTDKQFTFRKQRYANYTKQTITMDL